MRHRLANLSLVSALGGCSLIYNPNNIPEPPVDAAPDPIDAFVADADPTMLEVLDAHPAELWEGQGDGGSRAAVLVLTGHHFIEGEISVQITDADGMPVNVMVDDTKVAVDSTRDYLAVPVTVPVDDTKPEGDTPLRVTVTQQGVTRTLDGELTLKNLDELTSTNVTTDPAMLKPRYSEVELTDPLVYAPSAADRVPAIIRAVASITVGDITANAGGRNSGPGGKAGGSANSEDAGGAGRGLRGTGGRGGGGAGHNGPGNAGSGGGLTGGGGGAGVAIGSPLIIRYTESYGSGGGSTGVVGGGGGGTIELSAGGSVVAGALRAQGAQGADGGGLGSGGGGGAGGVIVLRGGQKVEVGAELNVAGGPASDGGGAGAAGRVRIDTPMLAGTTMGHRGVAFDPSTPLIIAGNTVELRVSGSAQDMYTVYVLDVNNVTKATSSLIFGTPMAQIEPELGLGYNRVCIAPVAGALSALESTNCVEIAFVP